MQLLFIVLLFFCR